MRKLGLFLSIVLVLGMVLAVSCGGGAAPAPTVTVTKTAPPVTVTVSATPGATPTVTVTVTPTPTPPKLVDVRQSAPAGGTALIYNAVGAQQGFFVKRGINLITLEMATPAARVAPFVGQADVSTGDILPLSTERKDVKIIGPVVNLHHSLVVRKDSPYKSYQDLKGKKIATLGPATGQYEAIKVLAGLEGLNLEKDFQLINGEAAVQIGWLLKGEVEAIHINEPFTSKLLVSDGGNVRELYWLNDLYKKHTGSNWPYGGVYTSEAWVKKNPELAKTVGLGFDDVFSYIYAHNQGWRSDEAKKVWKTEDPKVLELLVQRMPRTVENPRYGPAYKEALVKRVQLVADAGLLPVGVTVDWYRDAILFAEN